jgi:hypothetical protein
MSNNDQLVLRGLAVPFGESRPYGDEYLRVAPLAFHAWLRSPDCHCNLVWGGHQSNDIVATTADRSLRLFADPRGVWFTAVLGSAVDCLWRRAAICRRKEPLDKVSANFVVHAETVDDYLGCKRRTITRAGADHIAITSRAAFGSLTGVWPNVVLDNAPMRIRDMAAEFDERISVSAITEFNFSGAKRAHHHG